MAIEPVQDILDSDQATIFQEAFNAGLYKEKPTGILGSDDADVFHEAFTAGLAKRRTLLRT